MVVALAVVPGVATAQGSWSQVYHEDQHAIENIDLESVTHGNGRFVAVGHANLKGNSGNRQPMIIASSDGTSWTDVSPALGVNGGYLWEVIHTGAQFVAVGNDSTKATGYNEETLILTSGDGLDWQRVVHSGLPLYNFWEDIAYGSDGNGNERYVLAADTSLYYSSDLVNWSEVSKPSGTNGLYWNAVAYGNGQFVAVGKSGSGYVTARMVSSDGADWSVQATSEVGKDTVEFVNARFINIGVGGGTYTSRDTVTWEEATPKLITATTIYSVDYANDTYVFGGGAVGTGNSSGYVWVTADLKNWWQERINGVTEGGIRSLAHDDSGFVGVSDADGMIYYSSFSSASSAPHFTSTKSISATTGAPLTYTVSADGLPVGTYYYHTYNLDPSTASYKLPAGLQFSASSGVGVLSGTPTEAGATELRFSIRPNSGVYVDGARAIEAEVMLVIGATVTATTSTTTTTTTSTTTTTAITTSDSKSDCLFDWAEASYSTLFSPATASMSFGPYYLRYYSQTNAYLAVTVDSLVYLGPLSDNKILDLGPATTWYAAASCN
ncbi:MAG: hypothetical protein WC681_23310 [Sterolibacterium sp.]